MAASSAKLDSFIRDYCISRRTRETFAEFPGALEHYTACLRYEIHSILATQWVSKKVADYLSNETPFGKDDELCLLSYFVENKMPEWFDGSYVRQGLRINAGTAQMKEFMEAYQEYYEKMK